MPRCLDRHTVPHAASDVACSPDPTRRDAAHDCRSPFGSVGMKLAVAELHLSHPHPPPPPPESLADVQVKSLLASAQAPPPDHWFP